MVVYWTLLTDLISDPQGEVVTINALAFSQSNRRGTRARKDDGDVSPFQEKSPTEKQLNRAYTGRSTWSMSMQSRFGRLTIVLAVLQYETTLDGTDLIL